jgi:hypothetical protein
MLALHKIELKINMYINNNFDPTIMFRRHLAKKEAEKARAEKARAEKAGAEKAAEEYSIPDRPWMTTPSRNDTAVHRSKGNTVDQKNVAGHATATNASSRPPKGKKNHSGKLQSVFSDDQKKWFETNGFVETPNGYIRTMILSSEDLEVDLEPEVRQSASEDEDIQSQWDAASEPPRELLQAIHSNDHTVRAAAISSIEEID